MKKWFTLDVMYGDADGEESFDFITDDEKEINFLTYFLENYTEDVFDFYESPSLVKYNKAFKDDKTELIKIVNTFNSLKNKIEDTETHPLQEDASVDDIHNVLNGIINFVEDYFDWFMYHAGMDYNGCPVGYSIENITGCTEMTKKEATEMIKDKLGIDIVIID